MKISFRKGKRKNETTQTKEEEKYLHLLKGVNYYYYHTYKTESITIVKTLDKKTNRYINLFIKRSHALKLREGKGKTR